MSIDRSNTHFLDTTRMVTARSKDLDSTAYSYKLAGSQFGLDAVIPDKLDIDEGRMAVRIPFADGRRRDGVGDLLEVGGIRTERHVKNPIIMFDHAKSCQFPIALAEDPATGAYTVRIDQVNQCADALGFFYQGKGMAGVERDTEAEHAKFCAVLFDLIAKRFVRAGSIGYQVVKAMPLQPDYERGTPQGLHLLSVLMLECSAVVLPANGDTVRKMLAMPQVKELPMLVKSLSAYAPAETKTVISFDKINDGKEKSLPSQAESHLTITNQNPPLHTVPCRINCHDKGNQLKSQLKSLRRKYKAIRTDSRAGQRNLGTLPAEGEPGKLPNLEGKLEERELATGTGQKSVNFFTAFDSSGKQILDFNSAFIAQTNKFTPQDKERLNGLALNAEAEVDYGGDKVRVVRWKKLEKGMNVKAADMLSEAAGKFRAFINNPSITGFFQQGWDRLNAAGHDVDMRKEPTVENARALLWIADNKSKAIGKKGQLSEKSFDLKSLRQKYRNAKNYRRRTKRSAAGSSILHVSEKDLPAVKEYCERRGLEFKHAGSGGLGLERVRLTGDDGGIDEAAKMYGKAMKSAADDLGKLNSSNAVGKTMQAHAAQLEQLGKRLAAVTKSLAI